MDYLYYYSNLSNEVPYHSHNCYELVYYYEGNGISYTNSDAFKYSPNHYAIYPPEVSHNEVHNTPTSVLCIGFLMKPDINFKINTGIYKDSGKLFLELTERIRLEFTTKPLHYIIMLDLLLSEFLVAYERQKNSVNIKFDEMHHIKSIINENFNQEISMDTLAEISGYSYHYFRHLFKLKTGMSPKNYILNKRIEKAKKMLTSSDINISYIAQSCGFCSSSQFGMIFKKQTGLSPSKYKKFCEKEAVELQSDTKAHPNS